MSIVSEGVRDSRNTWFGQFVGYWIVESWAGEDCLAFGGPCSNESAIHKLRSAEACKTQADKQDPRYCRDHAGNER